VTHEQAAENRILLVERQIGWAEIDELKYVSVFR
jgi:hypothetical protein